jgi:hypothetical protein
MTSNMATISVGDKPASIKKKIKVIYVLVVVKLLGLVMKLRGCEKDQSYYIVSTALDFAYPE